MIDKKVSHYRIIRKLGSGGMGEVWLAEDTRLEREVAIKFLPYHATQDETEKARFFQEAKAAARLSHSNIAQVFEIGEEEGRLFIVMEYVRGGSLRDWLDKAGGRSIPLDEVLSWIKQAAEGLAEAHRLSIVHRDIKPDNLMITELGQLKITDFGLARLETTTRLTAAGATLGTVNYMSPEQVTGKDVDHRADIFSLGATIYELLTGHRAFEGTDANSTYFSILNDQTEPLSRYRRDMPEGLEQIILKMLDKDPALRYQSALDVVSDLLRLEIVESHSSMPTKAARFFWERVVAIPGNIWISILLLAVAFHLQTSPNIAVYRSLAQDTFLRDLAKTDTNSSPLVPLANSFVITRERILSKFEELLSAGSVDAHIAAAAIEDNREKKDEYLASALEISPTDATLHALRADFRFAWYGIRDDLAHQHALRSAQLDPDNGVNLILAAVGAAASGDTATADTLFRNSIQAPDFSFGWTRYYSSLYRTLVAVDYLHPTWQLKVSTERFDYLFLSSIAYLDGRSVRDPQSTDRFTIWDKPEEGIQRERAEIIEAIGNRLTTDRSFPLEGLGTATILIQIGLGSQLSTSLKDESKSNLLWRRNQAAYSLDLVGRFDFSERNQFRKMMVTSRQSYQIHIWSWYMLIWSILFSLTISRIRFTSPQNSKGFAGTPRSGEWDLSLIWLFGTWIPFLFFTSPWTLVELISQFLFIGITIALLFQLTFRKSLWHQRKSGIRDRFEQAGPGRYLFEPLLKKILVQPAYSRAVVGLFGILAIVWILPEIIIRRLYPDALGWDFDLLVLYCQIALPILVFPFLIRGTNRKYENAGLSNLNTQLILFSALLVFTSTIMMWLWSQPYGERLLTIMHASEPSLRSGTIFPY